MFSKLQKKVSKSFKKAADFMGGVSPPLKRLRQALLSGDEPTAIEIYTSRQYTSDHDENGNNIILCLQETMNPSELFPFTHHGDQTPLHLAAESAMERMCVLFLENGADPNIVNGRGETALHSLCSRGERPEKRLRIFNILIEWRGKVPKHVPDSLPMPAPVPFVSPELIDGELGAQSSDVVTSLALPAPPPLPPSSSFVAQPLVVEGETMSINRVDSSGNSALHFAASNGLIHIVVRLLELGAIISIVNRAQQTCCELVDSMAEYKYLADILEVALVYQPQSQDECVFAEFQQLSDGTSNSNHSSNNASSSSPRFGLTRSSSGGSAKFSSRVELGCGYDVILDSVPSCTADSLTSSTNAEQQMVLGSQSSIGQQPRAAYLRLMIVNAIRSYLNHSRDGPGSNSDFGSGSGMNLLSDTVLAVRDDHFTAATNLSVTSSEIDLFIRRAVDMVVNYKTLARHCQLSVNNGGNRVTAPVTTVPEQVFYDVNAVSAVSMLGHYDYNVVALIHDLLCDPEQVQQRCKITLVARESGENNIDVGSSSSFSSSSGDSTIADADSGCNSLYAICSQQMIAFVKRPKSVIDTQGVVQSTDIAAVVEPESGVLNVVTTEVATDASHNSKAQQISEDIPSVASVDGFSASHEEPGVSVRENSVEVIVEGESTAATTTTTTTTSAVGLDTDKVGTETSTDADATAEAAVVVQIAKPDLDTDTPVESVSTPVPITSSSATTVSITSPAATPAVVSTTTADIESSLECGICGDDIDICFSAQAQLQWSTRLQQIQSQDGRDDTRSEELTQYLAMKTALETLFTEPANPGPDTCRANMTTAALSALNINVANSTDPVLAIQCQSAGSSENRNNSSKDNAHTYCITCWRSYLAIQIHEHRCGELHCPGYKCTECLDTEYWGGLLFPTAVPGKNVGKTQSNGGDPHSSEMKETKDVGERTETVAADLELRLETENPYILQLRESRLQTAVATCDYFHICNHIHDSAPNTSTKLHHSAAGDSSGKYSDAAASTHDLCGLVVCTDSLPIHMLVASADRTWYMDRKFLSCFTNKYKHYEKMNNKRARKIATNCHGVTTPSELRAALKAVTQMWPRTVICGNSHAVCTTCNSNAHAPCPCGDWSRWQHKIDIAIKTASGATGVDTSKGQQADIANALWVAANTKKCPKCALPIEKDDGCNHMVCRKCKHEFCWICMQEWGLHNNETGGYFQCNRFVESTTTAAGGGNDGNGGEDSDNESDLGEDGIGGMGGRGGELLRNANDVAYMSRVRNNAVARFIHHFSRYSAHSESGEKERKLKAVAIQRLRDTLLFSSVQSQQWLQGGETGTETMCTVDHAIAVVNIVTPGAANKGRNNRGGDHYQNNSNSSSSADNGDGYSTPQKGRPAASPQTYTAGTGTAGTPSTASSTPGSSSRRPSLLHSISSAFGGGSSSFSSFSASPSASKISKPRHGEPGTPGSPVLHVDENRVQSVQQNHHCSSSSSNSNSNSSSSVRAQFTPTVLIPSGGTDHFPSSPAEVVIVTSSTEKGYMRSYCPVQNPASTQAAALPWLQGDKEPNPFDHLLRHAVANPCSVSKSGSATTTNSTSTAKDECSTGIRTFHLDLQAHPAIAFLIHAFDELYACRQLLRGSYAYAFYAFKSSYVDNTHSLRSRRFLPPPPGRSGSTHMHHFYPSGDVSFSSSSYLHNRRSGGSSYFQSRADFEAITRYKELFERLQAELEMTTEILSDVVARARLRATKTHIIAATSRASLKRREFEACVFSYWENVAINTVATNLSESANAATDGGAGIGSSGDMGGMSEGGLGNRDYYYFADRGRHREHEREEREINQAYLPRMRRHASDQNDFRLFSQQSRRDRDSDNVRSRGDLSPPSQGGSVEALLEHMGRNVGHEDGDIEGDVVSRRRDQGMDFEDGDDFDIAAAIGWIEQLTLNQQGGGSSSRTDLARSSIRPRHGRGSGRGANSSSGGSDIASGGGAADMNALDFSNLLSPAVAVGSDHATADDNNNDDDGNDHASASASLVDTDAVAPVASSVVTATVTATAGTNEGDVAVNVDINERTVGSEAAAAIVAVVGLGDEQVNVEIAAGAPVVDSSRNHHGIVAGQSRAADQILSVLSAEERERLGMAVSARRGRSVEPDEFRSNELLFGALSSREQRRLVNMLRDSGRLPGSSSSRRTGSNRGRTISDSGDGDRDRENAEDPSVFQREHGRRNRLQAAAVAMPPAAPGADTDVNTVASTADSESASPPRLVIESSDGDRHERGRHSRRHHQSQTEVHNDRLLRIALRMEEEEAMERAILMSLQRPTNTNSGGTGEGLGSGSGSAVGGADATANKESLQLLVSMGFDREQCISALIHCNNDVEQATVRLCADIES